MKYGIIVATTNELEETKSLLEDLSSNKYYNLDFYAGKYAEKDIVVVRCNIGKVNAARTAQILIDKFNIDKIINIGVAGAVNSELNVKDIVIGSKLVQYDFDVTEIDKVPKGYIQDIGLYIESDKNLINICKQAIENIKNKDFNYKIGAIASADKFLSNQQTAKQIRNEFNAECIEMEGAAIAQVCYLDQVPFVVIRGISDTPNGNNGIDYTKYCQIAAKQAAMILKEILKF